MVSFIIERIREERRIGKAEFAEQIEMTRQGYDNALKNDNFRTNTLKIAAQVLGVHITHFFNEENGDNTNKKNYTIKGNNNISDINDSRLENSISYDTIKEIEGLKQELSAKDREIKLLSEMKDQFRDTAMDKKEHNDILFRENQELKQEIKELKAQLKN